MALTERYLQTRLENKETLEAFLKDVGLGEFASAFHEYGIDSVSDLKDDDLASDTSLKHEIGMGEEDIAKLRAALDEITDDDTGTGV